MATRRLVHAVVLVSVFGLGDAPPSLRGQDGFCPGASVEQEPNDTPASGTAVDLFSQGLVRAMWGTISTPGDVDHFRITLTGNERVWLSVDTGVAQPAGGNTRDSVVDLLDAGGTTIFETDDDDGTGNGRDASVESLAASAIAGVPLAAAGVYTVRVRAKSPTGIFSYVLHVTRTSQASASETEPNDTPAQAQFGFGPIQGSLSGPGDVDYYRANLLDAGTPFIAVDGDPERDGTGTNVIVGLEPPTGPPASLTVDSSGSGGPGNPPAEAAMLNDVHASQRLVRVTGPAAGTYRINVSWAGYCPVPVGLERLTIE